MEKQNQMKQSPFAKGDAKRRGLLIILLLITLFSSVMVGFLIGKNSDTPMGQLIDTIVIGSNPARMIHLSGQVLYTNGTPYQNGMVELHSEPLTTMTDTRGRFFYEQVEPGEHQLVIVDEEGKTLAACKFSVTQDASDEPINIYKKNDGKYAVELSVDVRFLELAVELDQNGGELKLVQDKSIVLEDDGTLTMNGKQMNVSDGVVVLPSGTVILTDKTVIVPDHVILPDNTVTPITEEGYTGSNGETVDVDGSVTLADGTIITSEGVQKSDGTIITPEEPYQIHVSKDGETDGSKDGTTEKQTESNKASDTPESNKNQTSPAPKSDQGKVDAGTANEDPNRDNPDNEVTDNSGSDNGNHGNGDSPVTPTDKGKLLVSGENASGWGTWIKQSTIDLFYRGTKGNSVIQPGSNSYYLFKLKNSRSNKLDVTLKLTEDQMHLPLEFTLTPLDSKGKKQEARAVEGTLTKKSLELKTNVPANGTVTYQLDWNWPLEGNDRLDTKAGITGGIYTLSLQINAEERP